MEINPTMQPTIVTADFGMPACGRAFGRHLGSATTSVVRDRAAKTQGHLGLAIQAYIPESTAWSPPLS